MKITMQMTIDDLIRALRWQGLELSERMADRPARKAAAAAQDPRQEEEGKP
ncbi:MAG: hypothetical protein ACRECY_06720 [Phyllobacterium sp.]